MWEFFTALAENIFEKLDSGQTMFLTLVLVLFFSHMALKVFMHLRFKKVGNWLVPKWETPHSKNQESMKSIIDICEQNCNDIKALTAEVADMSQFQCLLGWISKDLPVEERVAKGIKYILKGGNGKIKAQVIADVKNHRELYRALFKIIAEGKKIPPEIEKELNHE